MAVTFSIVQRLAAVALLACLFVTLTPPPQAEAATATQIRDGLERKINKSRVNHGRRPLGVNSYTQKYSKDHAAYMAAKGFLVHDTINALWNEVPGDAEWVGENVGYTSTGPGAVRRMHRAFMKSPAHRANILKGRATHMGLGVVKSGGKVWVVQRFIDRW